MPMPRFHARQASGLARKSSATCSTPHSNNHQRFVRAQFTDELVCPTYDQDAWVHAQRYREAPWNELVSLWALFNLHLARVMAAIPAELRRKPRMTHNLDQVAFRPLSASEPATLEFFMQDYVVHLDTI